MKSTMIKRKTSVLFLIAVSFILIQCDNRADTTDRTDNRNTAYDQERTEMTTNLENLKDDIDNRIDELDSRIDNTNDNELERNLEAQKRELNNDRSNVDRAIDNIEDSSEDTWRTVRTESESLYDRISSKLDEWSDRLQNQNTN